MTPERQNLPARARLAALLFGAAGVVVVAVSLTGAGSAGAPAASVTGPVLRGLALLVIAGGLLGGARWGWLLGLVFPGAWIVLGAIRVAGADPSAAPGSTRLLTVLVLAVLAAGWLLLLSSDVRRRYGPS